MKNRVHLIECASSTPEQDAGEVPIGDDFIAGVTEYGPQPCLLCGAPPVYTCGWEPKPDTDAGAMMIAKFGTPPPGKGRVLVYFLCASHNPEQNGKEVGEAVQRVIFADVLARARA